MEDEEIHRRIVANTAIAIGAFHAAEGADAELAPRAITWLDGQVRAYAAAKDGASDSGALASVWGSFFGECLIRSLGGRWTLMRGYDVPWFGVAFDGVPADADEVVCFRNIPPGPGVVGPASRSFRDLPGGERIPVSSGIDALRQSGRIVVNPWSVVLEALEGDQGASVEALYGWVDREVTAVRAPEQAEATSHNLGIAAGAFREQTGEEPRFDLRTIEWIDASIRRFAAAPGSEEERYDEFLVLGAAFGECLRRCFDGEWRFAHCGFLMVYVPRLDMDVNPWSTVRRGLEGKDEGSALAFYGEVLARLGG